MVNDPVGDMLTRIRNGQSRRRNVVQTPGSRLRASVLDVLKSEGYIRDYAVQDLGNGRTEFAIELKYYDGRPVIREIKRVSKPGRRVYSSVGELPRVADGLGVTIISTPQASWPITRRASATSAVKCSARCSDPEDSDMSRVGKKPVPVPSGVTATVTGQTVKMKGSKGELQFVVPPQVIVEFKDGAVSVQPKDQSKQARSLWGTSRAQVANLVEGVSKGFEKKLEITGVGYRAAMAGKALKLSLGYSHDIEYEIPAGITIVTPKPTEIVVSGIDRQRVGQVAAEIREYRGPEPYKGKGVKYAGEFIFRKEGKKK